MNLPPLRIAPRVTSALWGGDALVRSFGKPGRSGDLLGESWECWDENQVVGGPYEGRTIADLRTTYGRALTGPIDPQLRFPVLTKIIDANAALSVQVHPDDAYAQRVEHQPYGKTECWSIIEAQPGAELVLGWTRDVTRQEVVQRTGDGTLGEVLRRIPVRAGDTLFLPAGTVHAIGAGIRLFETQQASDLTYRLFDWNRVDAQGRPRELHVTKAAEVLDERASTAGPISPLTFKEDGTERSVSVVHPSFALETLALSPAGATLDGAGRPLTLTAADAPLRLASGGMDLALAPWETVLIPASCGPVALLPERASARAYLVRVAPDLQRLAHDARGAGFTTAHIRRFFAQFGALVPEGN